MGLALALPVQVGKVQAETVQGPARVIDGDTLAIGRVSVRLHGIDAPEHDQLCKDAQGRDWSCGQAAAARLAKLVGAGHARCAGEERDRYDRLIAICTAGGRDLNKTLVAEGMAEAYRKYALDYDAEEQVARAARRGIWQGAHRAPEAERHAAAEAPSPAAAAAPGACQIKGNISKSGHIFHLPGSRSYGKTKIDPRKGERWFCSPEEAIEAGWRPARG